jgi:hypothetical protein
VYVESETHGNEGSILAQKTCEEVVAILERTVDKLRENAQQLSPQPLRNLGISKPLNALITAFANTDDEPSFRPELVRVDGGTRAIPNIDSAILPTKIAANAASMSANHKIIGLVRGDELRPNEFILEGGVSVQLPKAPPFTWGDIHLVLETAHWQVGRLVRIHGTSTSTVDPDTKIVSQVAMDIDRK